MKTIFTSLLFVIALTSCELKDVNQPAPISTYVPPDFKVPAIMLGEYVNSEHNFNKGAVSISETIIRITTDVYSIEVPVSNQMYYNGCCITIYLSDGTVIEVWHYKGHDFINIKLIDEGVEYGLGRFEPFKEVVPSEPEEPTKPETPVILN